MESEIRRSGAYGIVEEYGGHGIGSRMHMDPHILNHGAPGRGPVLTAGMALAIEPMATIGSPEVAVLDDAWTVVTMDGSVAAHWAPTVAVTDDGPWVLDRAGRRTPLAVRRPPSGARRAHRYIRDQGDGSAADDCRC